MNTNNRHLLKGRNDFLPWMTRLEGLLTLEEVVLRVDGKLAINGDNDDEINLNEKKARRYILENCDLSVLLTIDPTERFERMLEKLDAKYGFGNMDPAIMNELCDIKFYKEKDSVGPSIIMNELGDIKFCKEKDPAIVFDYIDKKTTELTSPGGFVEDSVLIRLMHNGLRDKFWFHCKEEMNMRGLTSFTLESAKNYIQRYWYAYRETNNSKIANFTKKKWEDRKCELCEKERPKIAKTHNTPYCRYKGNKEGHEYSSICTES